MFHQKTPLSRTFVVVAVLTATCGIFATTASAQRSGVSPRLALAHTWHHALSIPGTVNLAGYVGSLSCPSAGNCGAAGSFKDLYGNVVPMVATESNGVWASGVEVPGTGGFSSKGGSARAISCASAGNCTVGGAYVDGSVHDQPFVATEVSGSWGLALQIPGLASLNVGGSDVGKMACSSPGNWSLAGYYADGSSHYQAFVDTQINGKWATAIALPGLIALNAGGHDYVMALTCVSSGNCVITGRYRDVSNHFQAFVANETNRSWGAAFEVPGTSALNVTGSASATGVACPATGKCHLVGYYSDGNSHIEAFLANEIDGVWSPAFEAPGSAARNVGNDAALLTIACSSIGFCSAGGYFSDAALHGQAMVINEANGIWSNVVVLPGSVALNVDGAARVDAVSCSSAGNCSAAGLYSDSSNFSQVLVANEINGIWMPAIEIPGFAALNVKGNTNVNELSCAPNGGCSVGGYFIDGSSKVENYVASEVIGSAPSSPLSVRALAANTVALVQWAAPAHTNGSPIFLFTVKSTSGTHTCTTISQFCVVSGLSNSKSYRFTVTATNLGGMSPRSVPTNLVRPHV